MTGSKKQKDSNWPAPKFVFEVTLGDDIKGRFQEVSGLDTEAEVLEYRSGNTPVFSTVKKPGLKTYSDVILKKGIISDNTQFSNWHSDIQMQAIRPKEVVIKLLDENNQPLMTWTLTNAWPVKLTGTDLNTESGGMTIETIELAYEGLELNALTI